MKFSEERELFAAAGMLPQIPVARPERNGLRNYMRSVADSRWYVLLIMLLTLVLGGLAAATMPPLYEANLLIQIADSTGSPKSILGEAANVFDIKTPATAEMEIMRSRMVVAPAVEKHDLLVVARPRRFPFIGDWHFREPQSLSDAEGSMTAGQSISVRQFEVPPAWEGETFVVRIEQDLHYSLSHPSMPAPVQGKVGELLSGSLGKGKFSLLVSQLNGPEHAEFSLTRKSRGRATEDLQGELKLVERGRQSGVVEATLRDTDPARAAAILNTIGANYVKQAVDRKSAEAEKTLAFLNTQLPVLKEQMDRAESAYNRFRSRKGSVSFDDEAKIALEQIAQLKNKLADAQQSRRDLLSQVGEKHPSVRTVDEQVSALQAEIRNVQGRISQMPSTQQDAQRLERDAKTSRDLYQQLRNNAMQLQLVREGLTGNARLIDSAIPPSESTRPKPAIILGVAAFAGLALSLLFALVRSGLDPSVKGAREIEIGTGLNVYSSAIPLGRRQRHDGSQKVLALSAPSGEAAVGLRQLRTLLQRQMRDRSNNILLMTGPTDGVGVHFIVSNLGAIAATAGRRTLLIDADRHKGSLHRTFGLDEARGLTDLVAGACTRKEAIRPTGIPRLDVITAGSSSADLEELASSRVFLDLLEHSSREYDLVLLAAPPVLRSSDTLSLAPTAAMVVLVARAGKTAVDEIAESARHLTQAGHLPSGVVLNAV